jgi:tricorn protease
MLTAIILASLAQPPLGYYRQPSLHEHTIVFIAEGDLWKVSDSGGVATRLTSHPGDESSPRISPDGESVAFTATYEGPTEVYVMPLSGGLPSRVTYDSARTAVVGWTPTPPHRVIASTTRYSTLPNTQLILIDPSDASHTLIPLAQASDGVFDPSGGTLFFTRLPFQGSQTKRYKGGTAQNIWRFTSGDPEARPLTADFPGTSTSPMWWQGRIYFNSDRDGTMEIWSMAPDGSDVRQETSHNAENERFLDVRGPAMDSSGKTGRIVYQLGADLWIFDPADKTTRRLAIRLDSDFDQTRDVWVKKPMDYLTAYAISPDGSRAVLTARGQVFVAHREGGRLVEVSRRPGVRYRNARFMPDGSILALSDESGEVEFWRLPANGLGERTRLTGDGRILRWEGIPSPDGRFIAHHDKNFRLFIFDVASGENRLIDENPMDNFSRLAWSPDSRYLSYIASARNLNRQVKIYDTRDGRSHFATTDRFDSHDAAWSRDGDWLYILSDRNISTVVPSPWGALQPEPFFDRKTRVYALALRPGLTFPFKPWDELTEPRKKPEQAPKPAGDASVDGQKEGKDEQPPEPRAIDFEALTERLHEVPIPPGNYSSLAVAEKRIFFLSTPSEPNAKGDLAFVEVANRDIEIKTLAKKVDRYDLSADGGSILLRSGDLLAIIDASAAPSLDLSKSKLNLDAWTFAIPPREEWRQMFVEAWRLERDYFYDTEMHGMDWVAMRDRYLPLVDRVATRAELSDLISQMVAELSALHIFVRGGDLRTGPDNVPVGMLGARFTRDPEAGGFRVQHIYESDPDEPHRKSPLARPGVDVRVGDVILSVNGKPALESPHIGRLLRNEVGRQVLLEVRPAGGGDTRRVIVTPISAADEEDLRYHEWEYTRRRIVERESAGDFGYIHLRAMGGSDMNEFAKGFYPVFNRKGLIIDVRHNRGGNIDSWLLSRLLRKAWFFWSGRVGEPVWNMQLAFRGHVVVLCNERTASDGEAFTEGIRRLGIGHVIGTRTWGGEIWLSADNFLVDGGIATAAEYGVYGPEGVWLIEGHGVEPDEVVDNLPHATFNGDDAQLRAAIAYLRRKVQEQPVEIPPPPKRPDKSFRP